MRITKIVTFEMAHFLLNHKGKCKNLHGHSYKAEITIEGDPIDDRDRPEMEGMLLDFSSLKEIIETHILQYDHSVMLNSKSNVELISVLRDNFDKVFVVPFNPTCEEMCNMFAVNIYKELQYHKDINLIRIAVKLWETATSFAEVSIR